MGPEIRTPTPEKHLPLRYLKVQNSIPKDEEKNLKFRRAIFPAEPEKNKKTRRQPVWVEPVGEGIDSADIKWLDLALDTCALIKHSHQYRLGGYVSNDPMPVLSSTIFTADFCSDVKVGFEIRERISRKGKPRFVVEMVEEEGGFVDPFCGVGVRREGERVVVRQIRSFVGGGIV